MILKPFSVAGSMAVMVFMFTAFLLTGQSIISRDKSRIRRRLHRLVVMHVAWAAIYFVCFAAAFIAGKGAFAGKSAVYMFEALAGQIVLGHTLNATMWFQVSLIYITVILAVLYSFTEHRTALIITFLAGVLAFVMQYSGANFALFGKMSYALKYPLGRMCEMLPLACMGIIFADYGIMNRLQERRTLSIAVCTVLLLLAVMCRKYIPSASGFGYSGLYLNVTAMLLTAIFCLLPTDSLPLTAKQCITAVSRFTPGVYCMHRLAEYCLRALHVNISNSFMYCIVIFIVCLAASFMISRVFTRAGRYLVE